MNSIRICVLATILATFAVPAERAAAASSPGNASLTYDVVVNKHGQKIRGSSGTASSMLEQGQFVATFPVNVSSCVWVATLGRGTTDGGIDERPGLISVAEAKGNSNGVYVETRGLGARLYNRAFHLIVAC